LIQRLSDQYNLVLVLPEGEVFSYYINSSIKKDSQFESYLIKDVIPKKLMRLIGPIVAVRHE